MTTLTAAQALDAAALEALYFVLALVDDDHEAKESAELSKRMREAAQPRPARMKARLPYMKARPAPRVQILALARERASGLVVA